MEAAISHMVGAFGRAPDILVNNLGLADPIPFESFSDEQWARAVDINLMGCVRTCRTLLPKMAALGSASVVNIASDLAKQPEPGLMAYGACKAALLHVTKNLAKEVRTEDSRERRLARTGLDAAVDSPRRHRRSARRSLRSRQGCGVEAIPGGTLYAPRDRAAGGCRARRGVSRVTAGEVYHRSESGCWRDAARTDLTAGLQRRFKIVQRRSKPESRKRP